MADGYVDEIDDDTRPEERELSEDAQWKKIQKNTFTRWTNQHLKISGLQIHDLQSELSDGLKLVSLIEVLASHQFKQINKRPTFRTQKLENVTKVLKFLEENQQLRIVNIDSSDIVDSRIKLILGLIWTLILHYSISMPLWEGEEPIAKDAKGKGPTPKNRILSWVNNKMPDKPVKNLTTDWNNGIAIGALVDALAPGLCPDWTDWDPKDALKNAKEAMTLAEKWLDIAQLLTPEELIDPRIDEKAMMTYLSQFPRAKLKDGAPLRPKTNPARVRAYGPGLDKTGNAVKALARFVVDTFSAGSGKLDILVLNPKGNNEPCTVEAKENQAQAYACCYVPTMEGEYRVIIKYASKEITNSPYQVLVEGAAGDPKKVTAKGPGIEKTGNIMGKKTFFNVFLNDAGKGNIECKVKDPHGREEIVKPLITKQSEAEYLVEYTPILGGHHSITVLFAGLPIPLSPFEVEVATDSGNKSAEIPKKTSTDGISLKPGTEAAYVTGRGVQPKGLRVNELTEFTVHTEKAGSGSVKAKIVGPGGVNESVSIKPTNGVTHVCSYTPTKVGQYTITVEYGQGQAQKSPFKVDVAGPNPSKVVAYGPGLRSGIVNVPAPFTVESHGSPGELSFSVEGVSEAKITCNDNGNGSCGVKYLPMLAGEYAVHVLCNKEEIKGSPFMAQISDAPKTLPQISKVKASGPGLEPNGVQANKETNFTVDVKSAGQALELKSWCWDSDGSEVPIKMTKKVDGTYYCTYMTKFVGKITVYITYGGMDIPKSPYTVNVSGAVDSNLVTAYGPGLQSAVVNKATTFTIDTKAAGGDTAPLSVDIINMDGKKVPFQSKDKDGKREIQYSPSGSVQTTYTINISYKNKPIKDSPYKVVVAGLDQGPSTGQAYASGRGIQPKGLRVNEEVEFTIHTEKTGVESTPKVKVIGPGGVQETVKVNKTSTYIFQCTYQPSKVGSYVVTAEYGGSNITGSPFKVDVGPVKTTKVKAYGPGLEKATVNSEASFTVETNDESSQLNFAINGPGEAKLECKDNGDGSVGVKYVPTLVGEYAIHVLCNNEDIPKSPFMVMASAEMLPKINASLAKVFGPGVEPKGNLSGKVTTFTVDVKAIKEKKVLEVSCMDQEGTKIPVQVVEKSEGVSTCSYTPLRPIKHTIYVTYGQQALSQSPYKVEVGHGKTGNVNISGPGIEKAAVGQQTQFTVDMTEVGSETKALTIELNTNKGQHIPFNTKIIRPGVCEVSYLPSDKDVSEIMITVNYEGESAKGSPFKVPVTGSNKEGPSGKVTVTGKGVLSTGIRATEPVIFLVHNEGPTVKDVLKTKIIGPGGVPVNMQTKKVSDNLYECQYTAPKEGTYSINVDMNNKPAEKSPFTVEVASFKETKIKAYGPGLEGGVAGMKAPFVVNTNGSPSELGFKVEGPSEAKITCKDNGDGTMAVEYLPRDKGEYVVHVLADKDEISQSPFVVDIKPSPDNACHPEKVKAYGPGLQTPGVQPQKSTQFTIDCSQAGTERPLAVKCYDSDGTVLPMNVTGPVKKVSQCQYTPLKKGKHMISVLYDGVPIASSPFTVNVSSGVVLSSVTVYGPGLKEAPLNVPTTFIIDSTKTPNVKGDVVHSVTDHQGRIITTKTRELSPGKQEVTYSAPLNTDSVTVTVTHESIPVEGSPFKVPVTLESKDAEVPLTKVTVSGKGVLPHGVKLAESVTFKVHTNVPSVKDLLKTKLIGPGGVNEEVKTKKVSEELYECEYTASKPGLYILSVDMNGKAADKAPFKINVTQAKDFVIKAYGPGLEGGSAGAPASFIVNTHGSSSELNFKVEGPSEAPLKCKDNGDGTVAVEYLPRDKGEYVVHVLADKEDILHSPFVVDIGPGQESTVHPEKVKAYGPGLDSAGLRSQKPAIFTVDCSQAGLEKPLTVKCYDSEGLSLPVITSVPLKRVSQCQYTPLQKGTYLVSILYDGVSIQSSPFKVEVSADLPTNVTAYGPGLEGASVCVPATFIIDSTKVTQPHDNIQHVITDDKGRTIPSQAKELSPGKKEVTYVVPEEVGAVTVTIADQGTPIFGSPFKVPVKSASTLAKTYVTGKGVLSHGIQASEPVSFKVHNDTPTPQDVLKTTVLSEDGLPLEIKTKKLSENLYECQYTPPKTGKYVVKAEMNESQVEKSPFHVNVVPLSESKIKAYGAGLERGVEGKPAMFLVNTHGSPSQLGFKVEGPGEAPIKCKDNGDGTVDVEYLPKDKGEYVVHVLADEKEISHSPFVVDIVPSFSNNSHPEKVKAYGPGLDKAVQNQKATQFTVDYSEAGPERPLLISCYDSEGSKVPVDTSPLNKTQSQVQYVPQNKGQHLITVLYDGVNVPHSPFKVNVDSPETSTPLSAYGPGLQNVPVNVPTTFTIDSSKILGPKGDIQCFIVDDKRRTIPTTSKEVLPGKEEITYTVPDSAESVVVNVTYEGKPIQGSPFYVPVLVNKDDKVTASGRGIEPEGLRIGEEVSFSLQSEKVLRLDQIKPKVVGPGGVLENVVLSQESPDKYQCTYTPSKIGPYSVSAEVDGKPVLNSPFQIDISGPCQSPVKAFGVGLEQGEVNKPAKFIVETNGHTGNIEFKVNGPGEAKIVCGDIEKGQVKVQYSPEMPGEYRVRVLSNGSDIKDSPFIVPIQPSTTKVPDLSKVKTFGPGLQPKGVMLDTKTNFSVDTKDCGSKPSVVTKCYNKEGKVLPITHKNVSPGMDSFEYLPTEKGGHIIQVLVDNTELNDSPFNIEVDFSTDQTPNIKDLDKALVYGKGIQSADVHSIEPNVFYADFRNCDSPPSSLPLLEVLDGDKKPVESHLKETNTPHLYEASYKPSSSPLSSKFYASVKVEENHIPKSPFMIQSQKEKPLEESVGNVKALQKNVKVNEPQRFEIKVKEGLKSEPKVLISDSCGVEATPVQVTKLSPNIYEASYTPKEVKPLLIEATLDQKPLGGTPANISVVTNPVDVSKVKVKGLAPIAQTGKPQSFDVVTSDTNILKPELIESSVISPSNDVIPVQKTTLPNGVRVSYTPLEDGVHTVGCWIQDQAVEETPCLVKMVPKKDLVRLKNNSPSNAVLSDVTKEPQLNTPCTFLVEHGGTVNPDQVQVKVLSPQDHSVVPLRIKEVPQGLLCEFLPTKAGPHSMIATVDNVPIKNSPSIMNVKDYHPARTDNLPKDAADLGSHQDNPIQPRYVAPVKTGVERPYKALEDAIKELKEKSTQESKWPQSKPEEPSSKVVAYGEGLKKVCATEKATFTIDSKDAPSAPLGVTVEGPGEAEIKCLDNGDGTCGVEYEAPSPGLYTVNVLYDNTHIPESPFVVVAYPKEKKDLKLSSITASGPGLNPKGVFKDSFARFTVDSSEVDITGLGVVKALVESPSGKKTLGTVENLKNGTYNVRYSPTEEGPQKIHVLYENLPIMDSPFIIPSKPGFNAKLVTAKGPGLETCKVNQPTKFNVDLDGAGHGSLGLSIEGPADAEIECIDNKDGTCSVGYTPTKAGEYDINVKFNDVDISESPFRVKVLDEVKPEKVKCDGPKPYSKPKILNHFTVNASEAGEAPLKISVEQPDQKVPTKLGTVNQVKGAAPGIFDVSFAPEVLGPCLVHVKYDDKPIKGSPFKTEVVKPAEVDKINISGNGIAPLNGTILASMPAIFYVDTKDAGVSPDVNVGLFNPNGEPMPLRIESTPNGLYTCEYQTHDVGNHKINVDVDGQALPKSPFTIMSVPTGDADKCVIKEGKINTIQVNEESVLTVETKEAGKGQITCTVKRIERQRSGTVEKINVVESVKVIVEEHPNGVASIHYTPKDEGEYLVEVKFGGNLIPNGKFTQTASYSYKETKESVMKSRRTSMKVASTAFNEINFGFNTNDMKVDQLKASVMKPSGIMEVVKIVPSRKDENKMEVIFQPTERGTHQLQIKCQDRPIPGSPYQFFVDTKGEGRVTAYGPGLSSGKTNEVAEFMIITKDAGPGGLSLVVEGPSKTEIKCEDNHDGTFKVFYIPQVQGDYKIIIKFKDHEIAASPFIAKITGDSMKKNQVAMGNSSEIPLEISVNDITNLTAELITPSKKQLPCIIKKMENGSLGVSFTPKEIGEHVVSIYEEGVNIRGSPFKINVKPEEVGDANKVKLFGQGLEHGKANEMNEFTIDSRDSGYGSLNISIEGPSKAEIDCREKEDGTCNVKYVPTQPGEYVINVKYAGKDVRGSPFKVMVEGDHPMLVEREVMEHSQEAAKATKIGGSCEINIKTSEYTIKDLKAFVHTPSGFTEPCDIEDVGKGNMKLKFVARECGIHYVTVLHKERHIPGSPFQFTVGNVNAGGSHNVTASGPGLERGQVDISNEFTIYTREAGAGNLSLAMEGPSKPKMEFQESQDKGSCAVKYYVTHPGEYELSIRFNDEHIANSPFRITVTDDTIESMKSKTVSSSLESETIKESGGLVSFTVSTSGEETSKLKAHVQTPSGKSEPAIIQQIGENQFGIKFNPTESGVHLVHVENNKIAVKGSPFRIQVGNYRADPGMVVASGEGLSKATVNEKAHFFVNTSNAGSGSLNVAMDGPSKVILNCHETDEGYEFTYVATAPGSYKINITFGGNFHIVGSPFTAIVSGTETVKQENKGEKQSIVEIEASEKRCVSKYTEKSNSYPEKVQCQGLGVKHAMRNTVNSFFIDGSQAGYDILLIGVLGPVRPCEEIVVKHVGNNQFTVDYVVRESGVHVMMVKWGDKDVPGSPFIVHVD